MPAESFFWYELMTPDVEAAAAFYRNVVGWNTEPFGGAGMEYIVVKAGDRGVGGIMNPPPGSGMPTAWLGYIYTDAVDAKTEAVKAAGGAVYREPADIGGGVGRFSVVADPQGGVFMLLQPEGPDQPPLPPMTPGTIGWHDYRADDWQKAFDFYAGLFGWTRDEAVDMEEMGTYQLVASAGMPMGGMMNRPPQVPVHWDFYFVVDGLDSAIQRVVDNGGQVRMGPMEVPGNQWVADCTDPQGANFGLLSDTK